MGTKGYKSLVTPWSKIVFAGISALLPISCVHPLKEDGKPGHYSQTLSGIDRSMNANLKVDAINIHVKCTDPRGNVVSDAVLVSMPGQLASSKDHPAYFSSTGENGDLTVLINVQHNSQESLLMVDYFGAIGGPFVVGSYLGVLNRPYLIGSGNPYQRANFVQATSISPDKIVTLKILESGKTPDSGQFRYLKVPLEEIRRLAINKYLSFDELYDLFARTNFPKIKDISGFSYMFRKISSVKKARTTPKNLMAYYYVAAKISKSDEERETEIHKMCLSMKMAGTSGVTEANATIGMKHLAQFIDEHHSRESLLFLGMSGFDGSLAEEKEAIMSNLLAFKSKDLAETLKKINLHEFQILRKEILSSQRRMYFFERSEYRQALRANAQNSRLGSRYRNIAAELWESCPKNRLR